jgi:NADH:ubiquinone oxidoreductase subunit 4 (subunit M)
MAWSGSAFAAVGNDVSPPAQATQPPLPHRPIVALATAEGARGPLVLSARDGAYVGEMLVRNDGGDALVVSRVAIRGDDDDVRAPARLQARFSEGAATTATLAPGVSKRVVVTWTPERSARARQVFAHVVVTSNDEQAGEVAMGVHAELVSPAPFFSAHLLSWVTFVPLLGAFAIVLLAGFGRGDERSARAIALVATALQCVFAVWLASVFRGDVTRLDGNDGYQLIEHAVWVRSFDVEYFVGVDGISMPMVLLTSLVSFLGCVASESIAARPRGYYALYLVLATGMMGVFVALDLLLFYVFWELMILPMVFPLHTWLPEAQAEAPTPVGLVLAAVLLKMGAYGILRINFAILPDATRWAAGAVVAFGVVSVIWGALCAMAQDDAKRLVAYASVSQMGFCLIGLGSLTPQGIAACLAQMVSHGVIVAMLVLLVGALEDRARTRSLRAFGGLAGEMPLCATFAGLAFVASAGVPGLAGVWGETLSLLGAFPSYRLLTVVGALGLVLGAAYNLGAFQRVFLGPFRESWRASSALEPFGGRFPDLTGRELATLAPFAVVAIVLGVWPVPLFGLIAGGVRDLSTLVDPAGPDQVASLLERASHALAMLQ